ncbi:MAG: hypothetical protein GX232_03730 [Acholeplasmataceae bacterium]|nr:hypothetical protein [Acholeplasmataceae bacterium]
MSKLQRNTTIVINGVEHVVNDLVSKLAFLPSEEFSNFLKGIGLTVPKKLKIEVLKGVLHEPVSKTIEERANLADELGYRLTWFLRYSEFQLESLLKFYNSTSLNKKYLEQLWVELLSYMMDKKVDDKDFHKLVETSKKYNQLSDEDILEYNLALKDSFYDEPHEIDGLSQNDFRPVLYKSSTLVELRELGKKYDVKVPRRLKKDQLAEIIITELKRREEGLTEEKEQEIKKMSIVLMQRFAKDNKVKASIELKKEEIIEYILSHATQTKEMYFLPSDSTTYEQEPEPMAPAPVVEEVEEVVEVVEEVEVREVVVEEYEEEDYGPILDEIRYLRGLLHDHVLEVEAVEELPEELPEEVIEERKMGEPIILNTAAFKSDKKHAKQDYNDLMLVLREMPIDQPEEEPADVVVAQSKDSVADNILTIGSWIIAIVLLGLVVFLLINYFQGGLF